MSRHRDTLSYIINVGRRKTREDEAWRSCTVRSSRLSQSTSICTVYTYIFHVVRICVSAMLTGTVVIHCNLAVTLCSTIHVKCVMQCKSGHLSCIVLHFLVVQHNEKPGEPLLWYRDAVCRAHSHVPKEPRITSGWADIPHGKG